MKLNIVTLILLIFVFAAHHAFSDETWSINKRANNLYKNKQYKEALKEYDDALLLSPSDARLKMNKGSTHYQLGEFNKAEEAYNAALSSDNKNQLADAHYNMGNILFRQGVQMYQQGPQQALEKFKSAYDHYVKSLQARPSDTDAKWNLQLAHQVMKQLEQQQQNQKDDKNKQDKNDKNKQDQNKQDNKDQNKNDQNKPEQDKDKQEQKDQDQQQQEKDKKEEQQNQQQEKEQQQNQDEKQQQQQSEMKEQQDIKKEEARRIIEMFADDADTLNKPMSQKKAAGVRQPTQDW